jgi:hypothetical protein
MYFQYFLHKKTQLWHLENEKCFFMHRKWKLPIWTLFPIPICTHVHIMGSFEQTILWFRSWPSSSGLNADAWWMTSPLGTPRGRYDEYSSLFSLSKKPRFNVDQERRDNDSWRWCELGCDSSGQFTYGASSKLCLLAATWNLHTHTNKYFAPNLRWGCQSHRFA